MKKLKYLFIFFFCFLISCFFSSTNNLGEVIVFGFNDNLYDFNFSYNDKYYYFRSNDFKVNLSEIQEKYYHNQNLIYTLEKMGFEKEEIVNYIFPEVNLIFKKLSSILNVNEQADEVYIEKNACKLNFIEGREGRYLDKVEFYNDIFKSVKAGKNKIDISLKVKDFKDNVSVKDIFKEKGCFTTNFETSSESRKNNIRVALESLDGLVLNEGEILSFNNTTGKRNQENGYQKAKIISNGRFVEDFGGGVCQVSTTLYNACLLAGLEVLEVHSHSLPVSYIEPSFDAMVSSGSSDLKIRNNTNGKLIITSSYENDRCKIKIFGMKNKFKITRHSEKIGVVKAEEEIIDKDYLKYEDLNLSIGEERRISYAKDGFVSRGYLNYYNVNGELVKTEKIRDNKYNVTKGIIVKREN